MHEAKTELRRRMRARRRAVAPDARRRASLAVRDAVLALDLPGPLMAYVSVRAELGTRVLIAALPEVCIPRIEGEVLSCRRLTDWIDGAFGVPTTNGPEVVPATILVPGLAFDDEGRRLGYGGGYYDRFIAAHPGATTVGLAYDVQRVEQVPVEPHDQVLDRVLFVSSC